MAGGFNGVERTSTFLRDYKNLTEQQQADVKECLRDLLADPVPAARRLHRITSNKPKVYSVDVYPNKSYKISFEIVEGNVVRLRRVATHRDIDRKP